MDKLKVAGQNIGQAMQNDINQNAVLQNDIILWHSAELIITEWHSAKIDYCEQTFKWNINGVIQRSLFQTMIRWKGLPGVYIFNRKKGKESEIAERQIVCEHERQSIAIEEK